MGHTWVDRVWQGWTAVRRSPGDALQQWQLGAFGSTSVGRVWLCVLAALTKSLLPRTISAARPLYLLKLAQHVGVFTAVSSVAPSEQLIPDYLGTQGTRLLRHFCPRSTGSSPVPSLHSPSLQPQGRGAPWAYGRRAAPSSAPAPAAVSRARSCERQRPGASWASPATTVWHRTTRLSRATMPIPHPGHDQRCPQTLSWRSCSEVEPTRAMAHGPAPFRLLPRKVEATADSSALEYPCCDADDAAAATWRTSHSPPASNPPSRSGVMPNLRSCSS